MKHVYATKRASGSAFFFFLGKESLGILLTYPHLYQIRSWRCDGWIEGHTQNYLTHVHRTREQEFSAYIVFVSIACFLLCLGFLIMSFVFRFLFRFDSPCATTSCDLSFFTCFLSCHPASTTQPASRTSHPSASLPSRYRLWDLGPFLPPVF